MARILLPNSLTRQSLEGLIAKISASAALEIVTSKGESFCEPGADLDLLQAVLTWCRRKEAGRFRFSVGRAHQGGHTFKDPRARRLAHLLNLIAKLRVGHAVPYSNFQRNLALGDDILLLETCVDSPYRIYSPELYDVTSTGPVFRGVAEISDLIKDRLLANGDLVPLLPTKAQREAVRLGTIAFELFKNTQQHATRLEDDAPNPFSVRGLSVLAQQVSLQSYVGDDALRSYLEDVYKKLNKLRGSPLDLLEISIYDSGVGLARFFKKSRSLTRGALSEEYKAVRECFELHATSKAELGKGAGLFRVQKELASVQGFMRLRTGRLGLFRSPFTTPVDERIVLWNLQTRSPRLVGEEDFEGTFFSLFVPVEQFGE